MVLFSLVLHIMMLAAVSVWSAQMFANRWPVVPVYTVNLMDSLDLTEGKQGRKGKKAKLAPSPVKEKVKEVKKGESKPKEEPKAKEKKEEEKPPQETKKVALAPKEQKKEEEKKPEKPIEQANKEAPSEKASPGERRPVVDPLVVSRGDKGEGGSYRGSLFLDGWTNFPFNYYLVLIRNRIGDNWNPSLAPSSNGNAQKVTIAFKIFRDGRISHPFIEETSGIPFLDQAALRAVLFSAPFPPLPIGFEEEYLGVHFGFEYETMG